MEQYIRVKNINGTMGVLPVLCIILVVGTYADQMV